MQQSGSNGQLIYVVDDDVSIARLLALNLTARGYQAQVFHSSREAQANLENDRPDLVLLDLVMPDCDGLEITRLIRQRSAVPIIMLSVRNETASKLAALDLGADDYITKPFRVEELLARIRTILRRRHSRSKALVVTSPCTILRPSSSPSLAPVSAPTICNSHTTKRTRFGRAVVATSLGGSIPTSFWRQETLLGRRAGHR